MSGGTIFQKPNGHTDYFDQITIGGYSFDCSVRVQDKRGDPSAIRCGRIVCFELECEGELVCYFDDGKWYITPDEPPYCHDQFAEAVALARDMMIQKWSNPDRVRFNPDQYKKKVITNDFGEKLGELYFK